MEDTSVTEAESKALALLLSAHLRQLSTVELARYLRETYRVEGLEGLSTDTVFAVEVERGNLLRGELSSIPVRWWKINGDLCQTTTFVDMRPYNAASDNGKLWPTPHIKYYAELPTVLSSESIGMAPLENKRERALIYRRLLTVTKTQNEFVIVAQQKGWLLE